MIVNLSRLGKSGTGMWQYSIKFVDELHKLNQLSGIVCSEENVNKVQGYGVKLVVVPNCVSNTSKISLIRPLLWFFYSYFLAFRLKLLSKQCTVVSTTHHALPFYRNQVITVHDIRPYYYPDSFFQKIYFHFVLPRALKRCKHIITVSYTVKDKIHKVFGCPAQKISVIYNAIDTMLFSPRHEKENYLLAVGASWKHKNIDTLLNVANIWKNDYKLIVIAGRTRYVDELKDYIANNDLGKHISVQHEVPIEKLVEYYQNASALVYPSIDEGFGIPPIEALSCLTPVIVSDIPVFKEVLSDVAIYVKPKSYDSWCSAFTKLSSEVMRSNEWKMKAEDCSKKYSLDLMRNMIAQWLEKLKI